MRARQSHSLIWTVAIAFAIVLVFASTGTVYAGQNKVDICHINGQGEYNIISIAEPAYDSHIAHGDKDVETFFIDADGDGFGSTSMTVEDCIAPAGFVDNSDDCDDTNGAVNPSATEIPGNGIDDDCNEGTPDEQSIVCPCSEAARTGIGMANDFLHTLGNPLPVHIECVFDEFGVELRREYDSAPPVIPHDLVIVISEKINQSQSSVFCVAGVQVTTREGVVIDFSFQSALSEAEVEACIDDIRTVRESLTDCP